MTARVYDFEFLYRAALALNNMAVTMTSQGCYEQAFETLKDAVITLKIALGLPTSDHVGANTRSIQIKLQQANIRLARPELCAPVVHIRVITTDDAFDSTNHLAHRQPHLICEESLVTKPHYLVRICTENACLSESHFFDFFTVIILFNLAAVSLICQQHEYLKHCTTEGAIHATVSTPLAKKKRHNAIQIFCRCKDLLHALFIENIDNPVVLHQLAYISSCILHELQHFSRTESSDTKDHEANNQDDEEETTTTTGALIDICSAAECNVGVSAEAYQLIYGASNIFAPAA